MGTQTIGAALAPDLLAGATIGTDLPESSTRRSNALAAVRLDDQALAMLEDLASAPLPALPPCADGDFVELMRALTTLPRRADDDTTGKLRISLYHRKLGDYPHAALQFMVSTVLDELDWFPTIAQCKAILARWQRDDGAVQRQASAGNMARAERRARFVDIMRTLERRELDQAGIDALPEKVRIIAAERGFLRLHDDGLYRARAVPCGTKGDSENGDAVL